MVDFGVRFHFPFHGVTTVMRYLVSILLLAFLIAPQAHARDTLLSLPISEALTHPEASAVLGENIKFYFGKQAHGKVLHKYGLIQTNKKTNALNKTDKEACDWVFLSAMKALKTKAENLGANAIVNIRSNYKSNTTSSETSFQCGAGNLLAGVALVGTVVRLED